MSKKDLKHYIEVNEAKVAEPFIEAINSGMVPKKMGIVLKKVIEKRLKNAWAKWQDVQDALNSIEYFSFYETVLWEDNAFDWLETKEFQIWKWYYFKAKILDTTGKTKRILYLKPHCRDIPQVKTATMRDMQIVVEGIAEEESIKKIFQLLLAK